MMTRTRLITKEYFIPGHVPSSKNSRIFNFNRKRSFTSKAVTTYIKNSKLYWEKFQVDFIKKLPKDYPVHIGFHFVRKSRHKYDFVNPLQTVQDLMVKYEWLTDDNMDILVPHPLEKEGTYSTLDSKNPGVFIQILN